MKFEKPLASLAACHDRERVLSMPVHIVIIIATVLVSVGTTMQR